MTEPASRFSAITIPHGPVFRLALTHGDAWESARHLVMLTAHDADLEEWLRGFAPAMEVMGGDPSAPVYAGIRFGGSMPERSATVRRLLYPAASNVIDFAIRANGIFGYRFGERPERIKLGVVDHWRTSDAQTLWSSGTNIPLQWEPLIGDRLRAHVPGPVAVELCYEEATSHWLGVSVSTPSGGAWLLDIQELSRLLSAVVRD